MQISLKYFEIARARICGCPSSDEIRRKLNAENMSVLQDHEFPNINNENEGSQFFDANMLFS